MIVDDNERASRSQLRLFAWCLALMLAVTAWRQEAREIAGGLRLVAAVVFAVGTVWPRAFREVHRALMLVTAPLRWLVGICFLVLVYYGLLMPLALCFRLVGRDALQRCPAAQAATYWQPRRRTADPRRYFREF